MVLLEIIVRVEHRGPFALIRKPNCIRTENVALIKQLVVVGGKDELAVGVGCLCKVFHNALGYVSLLKVLQMGAVTCFLVAQFGK